jgi:hypothetical protein
MPIFTSGTKTIFRQTSAPTGWTKETVNFNNHTLRVTNGATSSGGSVDFTTVFSPTAYTFTNSPFSGASAATTLSISQIPLHNHPIPSPGTPTPQGSLSGSPVTQRAAGTTAPTGLFVSGRMDSTTSLDPATSTGHSHPISVTASGTVFTIAVRYVDVIIATLN